MTHGPDGRGRFTIREGIFCHNCLRARQIGEKEKKCYLASKANSKQRTLYVYLGLLQAVTRFQASSKGLHSNWSSLSLSLSLSLPISLCKSFVGRFIASFPPSFLPHCGLTYSPPATKFRRACSLLEAATVTVSFALIHHSRRRAVTLPPYLGVPACT